MLNEKGIAWSLHSAIEEVMEEVDILYMTRVQKERLDPSEYANVKAQFTARRRPGRRSREYEGVAPSAAH